MVRRLTSFVTAMLVVVAPLRGHADTPTTGPNPSVSGPEEALDKKIAVWRFDALGIDAEFLADRREALLLAGTVLLIGGHDAFDLAP